MDDSESPQFSPAAHLSLHFWTPRKLIWRKKIVPFYPAYFLSCTSSHWFFFSSVITIPLSHVKIATLFLCVLQLVQFTLAQLPHWHLFTHFIWTVVSKLCTHLTFLQCTGPRGCQQQGDCPLLPEVSAPEASWPSRLLDLLAPTAAQSVTSVRGSLWVWRPLEGRSLLYMTSGTLKTWSVLVVMALLSLKETLDTSKTQKWQPSGVLTSSGHAPQSPS